ncbi:MAG TPA: hypothetical protein IAB92_01115 [Candidatus Faecousia faecigallinarum]|nr:hypothetical protein [Candidatus Faecousia faecigallinarum]
MSKLPGAKLSPRIENGALCWYAGDTFSLDILLELTDTDGEPVTVGAADTLTLTVYDSCQTLVETISYTNVTGNRITLTVDEIRTAKYPPGAYRYTLRLTHGQNTTLAWDNPILVE